MKRTDYILLLLFTLLLTLIPKILAQPVVGEPTLSKSVRVLIMVGYLVLLVALFLPIYYFIKKSPMKTWLKFGFAFGSISLLFWVIMFIRAYITIVILNKGGDIAGLALIAIPYYGIISTIIAFGVGAIIGAISKKIGTREEISTHSKGWKIGFWIGLVFAIIVLYFQIQNIVKDITRSANPFPQGITFKIILNIIVPPLFSFLGILISFTLIGLLVGWIVGKTKSKKQI